MKKKYYVAARLAAVICALRWNFEEGAGILLNAIQITRHILVYG